MNDEIWTVLDLAPVRNRDAIRRAYARRLKVTSPEDDAEAFRTLREAYDEALASLDWDWAWEDQAVEGVADVADADAEPTAIITLAQLQTVIGAPTARPVFAAPPTPPGEDGHERLIQALEQKILVEPQAEPVEVEAALAAIMASPTMEAVATAAVTEQRIAYLIVSNLPRADALVRPAINAFKWERERVRARYEGLIEAVLDRDADIIFRNGLLSQDDLRRTAFKTLTRALDQGPAWHDRLWPGFENALRDLMVEIDHRRPSLRADLNADTVAHWREWLDRPRLSAGAIWTIALAPLLPALVGLIQSSSPLVAGAVYLAGGAGLLAAATAWSFGLAPLRMWWRQDWDWRAPIWARVGWAPSSLALLVVAAFLPDSPLITGAVGTVAAALAAWAVITCEIEPERAANAWPWYLRLALSQGLLVAWWIFALFVAPDATPGPLTAAFAGAVIASAAGTSILSALWYRWTVPVLRFAMLLGLSAAGIWTASLLFTIGQDTGRSPTAAMATAGVILAHRPAANGLGGQAQQWRYRAMVFSIMPLLGAIESWGLFRVSCLWLLIGVAASLVGAVLVERDL